MLIKDIYRTTPITVDHFITVKEALQIMVDQSSNGLIVVDKDKKVLGILALQDIVGGIVPPEMKENVRLARAMYTNGYFEKAAADLAHTSIKDIMRTEYMKVSPLASIMEIAADFLQNDLYIVPVVEHGKLVGVVSRSEIKKALANVFEIDTKGKMPGDQ